MSEAQRPLGIYLRGCAMGAADIVPGVSGGTIALITGIYLRLLASISAIPEAAVRFLSDRRWRRFWQQIDGTFLLVLLAGILTSVFVLASVITWLMTDWPVLLWSFFAGLIVGGAVLIARQVPSWSPIPALCLSGGLLVAFFVTQLSPMSLDVNPLMMFVGGTIAISAMILPGISGSFMLLLMGLYAPVLQAVRDFQLGPLLVFASGCLLGLLVFARVVASALRHFPSATLALLTGLMLGALPAVWPWQLTAVDAVQGDRVLPLDYAQITGEAHLLPWAFALAALGFLLVLLTGRQPGQAEGAINRSR